jgi:hypothetical protein
VRSSRAWPAARTFPTVKAEPDDPRLVTPPAKPRKRGVDPAIYAANMATYRETWRARTAAIGAYNRERSMRLGVEQYTWIAAVSEICDIAARNNGKLFRYDTPPPDGHPGEGECHSPGHCLCIARSVIPGLDR